MDPQSRPAEFSSDGARPQSGRGSQDPPGSGTSVGRVHFPRAERHDRFSGGQKAARMVGARLGAHWYSLACPDPLGDRGAAVGVGRLALRGCSTGRDWATVSADRFLGWTGVGPPAQGRWRIGRPSTRPVLKHGPRSLTCARVVGSYETRRRSESEGSSLTCSGGIPGARPLGAPPARLVRAVGEAEQERARWDPKDGELCLSRTKPEETLVEVRSDSDVQIDRQTWV